MLNDDGDIIRAVGYVAVYGAYLEDRIAELIELTEKSIELRKNIHNLSASDQVKHLLTALTKKSVNIPTYRSRDADIKEITQTLKSVQLFTEERNHVIHSVLMSNTAGIITQINRRSKTRVLINSKEVIDFANDLFSFQTKLSSLKFPIKRLLKY